MKPAYQLKVDSSRIPSSTPGVFPAGEREDLFKTVDTRVFLEVPAEASAQFKLLAKQ